MLTIQSKMLGRRRPLMSDFSFPPPAGDFDGEPLTLRILIAHLVRQEVHNFTRRQSKHRFDRVLTEKAIAAGEQAGRIAPEGRPIEQNVDIESAIANAWQAFEDGLYLVFIDGTEYCELDAQVHLRSDSTLTFVRLTFLAGA